MAKLIGTIVTFGGVLIIVLVHGHVKLWAEEKPNHASESGGNGISPNSTHFIRGSIILMFGYLSSSGFIFMLSTTSRVYPAELSLTAWICFIGTIEGGMVAAVVERSNTAVGRIHLDSKLGAGVCCSGLAYYMQGFVIKYKGPIFLTAFNPLNIVLAAIASTLLLHEQCNLGSILGATIIVLRLYTVLWGKSKDNNTPEKEEQEPAQEQVEEENGVVDVEIC
uniref:WAT1-related protein n=1 Tax=Nicotiana tabacum TaxID=4097 RepID=A0A1S3XDQ2_TOBAC